MTQLARVAVWLAPVVIAPVLCPLGGQFALAQDSKPRAVLKWHFAGTVTSLSFTGDSKTLMAASLDGDVRLWDVVTNKERLKLGDGTRRPVAAISADGRLLAWGGDNPNRKDDAVVILRDLGTGKQRVLKDKEVRGVAISADGKTLAWGTRAGVKLWDLTADKERPLLKHLGAARLAFSPDGKALASVSPYSPEVKVWDVATGEERAALVGHTDQVWSVAFTTDGKTLATGGDDQTVKLWDLTTGKERATLKGHPGVVRSVAVTADGKLLASGGYQLVSKDPPKYSGVVKLWDPATGKERATLKLPEAVNAVAISADGKTLAVAEVEGIKLWDVADVLAQKADK
jgi:WD40 repeat protein